MEQKNGRYMSDAEVNEMLQTIMNRKKETQPTEKQQEKKFEIKLFMKDVLDDE